MKAIAFTEYGPSTVLQYTDVTKPVVQPDELLVRVRAAGVNPADWRIRNGQFRRAFRIKMPFVPGSDIAGEVEQVGSRVSEFRIGDSVFGLLPLKEAGGYAEIAAIKESSVALIPAGGGCIEYGAIPLAGLTAWQGLTEHGSIQPGQSVLINGGSGGVGSFAVQIARAAGAEVTAVTSGRNVAFVRSLGALHVIDYTSEDVFAGPPRFDLILDAVADQPFRRWAKVLHNRGTLVTVNPIVGKVLPRFVTRMFGVNRLVSFFVRPDAADLSKLAELIASHQVVPQVQTVFELAQAVEAQTLSEAGHTRGKVVLRVDVKQAESRIATFDAHESLGNAMHDGLELGASQPAHRKEFPD